MVRPAHTDAGAQAGEDAGRLHRGVWAASASEGACMQAAAVGLLLSSRTMYGSGTTRLTVMVNKLYTANATAKRRASADDMPVFDHAGAAPQPSGRFIGSDADGNNGFVTRSSIQCCTCWRSRLQERKSDRIRQCGV